MTGRLKAVLLLDKLERTELPAGTYLYRTRNQKVTARINKNNQSELNDELRKRVMQRQGQFTEFGIPMVTVSVESTGAQFMAHIFNQQFI